MLTIHFAGLKNSLALMLAPALMLVPERQAIVPSLVYIGFIKLCQLPRAGLNPNTNKQTHILFDIYRKTYILNTPKQSFYSLVKNILFGQRIFWHLCKVMNFQVWSFTQTSQIRKFPSFRQSGMS